MKKQIIIIAFILLFNIFLVCAESSFVFKQNEEVNFRFRCLDENNNYCSSSTQLLISIEYPNGSNAYDNSSMTYNETYFNHTLPTDTLGEHNTIIVSPTVNGTVSEFDYEVTATGHMQEISEAIGSFGFLIMMIALTVLLGFIGFKLSETENLWVLGIFFLFLMLLFLVFDIYLGYEYRLNYTGANNDSTIIEILFYSFLFLFTAGVAITIVLLFRKWHKIVDWFKAALKNDAEPDDDYFSGQDDFR